MQSHELVGMRDCVFDSQCINGSGQEIDVKNHTKYQAVAKDVICKVRIVSRKIRYRHYTEHHS